MNLLDELRADYNLCINNPGEYQRKVNSISDLFILKKENRLVADYCPVHIFGKYQTSPFVMFGINPGISPVNSPLEDQEARKSWSHYLNLYVNIYGSSFSHFWIASPYYKTLYHLIAGLSSIYFNDNSGKQRPELFDTYLTNLELIPYHSNGISLPARFSTRQLDYLTANYTNCLEFIINQHHSKPKLFLFNGSPWYNYLIKNNLVKHVVKVGVLQNFNLYFFEVEGIPSVLFDKFFQLHYYGMTNHHRRGADISSFRQTSFSEYTS